MDRNMKFNSCYWFITDIKRWIERWSFNIGTSEYTQGLRNMKIV